MLLWQIVVSVVLNSAIKIPCMTGIYRLLGDSTASVTERDFDYDVWMYFLLLFAELPNLLQYFCLWSLLVEAAWVRIMKIELQFLTYEYLQNRLIGIWFWILTCGSIHMSILFISPQPHLSVLFVVTIVNIRYRIPTINI